MNKLIEISETKIISNIKKYYEKIKNDLRNTSTPQNGNLIIIEHNFQNKSVNTTHRYSV